jgi:hypothetical protein
MEPVQELAISTLRTLLFLGNQEEKKLKTILSDDPAFRVKMQTRTDLERLLRNGKIQSDELARLEVEPE